MKRSGRRRGFTLIECLVTTVILGLGVVGVVGMFTCATISERKAAHMARARHLAEQTIEAVRAGEYAVFEQTSGTATVETPGLPHSTGVLAWQPYPTGATGLKLVALNLSWDWAGSSSGKYTVVTLVSERGSG